MAVSRTHTHALNQGLASSTPCVYLCALTAVVRNTHARSSYSHLLDVVDAREHPDAAVVEDRQFLRQLLLARLQRAPRHGSNDR